MGNDSYQESIYMSGEDFLRDARPCGSYAPFPSDPSFKAQFNLDMIGIRKMQGWSKLNGQMVGAEVR